MLAAEQGKGDLLRLILAVPDIEASFRNIDQPPIGSEVMGHEISGCLLLWVCVCVCNDCWASTDYEGPYRPFR